MKTIDTKSLLIGLLLGVCIFLVLGATSESQKGDAGRYQVACPDATNVCFVIDTQTGHVWRKR